MADDDLARLRAQMDQAREGVKEFAGSLWAFYSELSEQGFSADQALALTLAFLSETFQMPQDDGE